MKNSNQIAQYRLLTVLGPATSDGIKKCPLCQASNRRNLSQDSAYQNLGTLDEQGTYLMGSVTNELQYNRSQRKDAYAQLTTL